MKDEALKSLKKIYEDKKLLFTVLLGVAGILLMLFAGPVSRDSSAKTDNTPAFSQNAIKKELEALLKTVDGVGKVCVYVTVENDGSFVYARDGSEKTDGEKTERSDEYVNAGDGGLLLECVRPSVRGVGISCEGGASGVVRQEVTKLVSAALGIPSNRIWVTKMKND